MLYLVFFKNQNTAFFLQQFSQMELAISFYMILEEKLPQNSMKSYDNKFQKKVMTL